MMILSLVLGVLLDPIVPLAVSLAMVVIMAYRTQHGLVYGLAFGIGILMDVWGGHWLGTHVMVLTTVVMIVRVAREQWDHAMVPVIVGISGDVVLNLMFGMGMSWWRVLLQAGLVGVLLLLSEWRMPKDGVYVGRG